MKKRKAFKPLFYRFITERERVLVILEKNKMAEGTISLKGLDRARVLAVLYNASKPQGMGFMHYDPKPMTREEAQALLDGGQTDFDYLKGRVMKIDLSNDELNPRGYDMDNGQGAAEKAISSLRSTGEVDSNLVKTVHRTNTQAAAREVKSHLGDKTHCETNGEIVFMHLGLEDVADVLNKRVDEGLKRLDKSK